MKLFKLVEDIYIPDSQPLIYVKSIDSLLAADLHLGIEGSLEREGVFLPVSVSLKVIEVFKRVINEVNPNRVIFLGDVKHEFGFPNPSEWINVKKMIEWIRSKGVRIEVVRGNHDNYLISILKKYNVPFHQESLTIGKYSFIHGHLNNDFSKLSEVVFMGHEHPSIRIRDEAGVSHKFKCFLLGECLGKRLIVLPSINELATGVDVNLAFKDEFLSPILRRVDVREFAPFLIQPGEIVEEFPKVKYLVTG